MRQHTRTNPVKRNRKAGKEAMSPTQSPIRRLYLNMVDRHERKKTCTTAARLRRPCLELVEDLVGQEARQVSGTWPLAPKSTSSATTACHTRLACMPVQISPKGQEAKCH